METATESPATVPGAKRGGRAVGLGRRRAAFVGRAAIALAAMAVLAGAGLLLTAGRGSTGEGHHAARYGGLPSWLPKTSLPKERIAQASASHRVLAIQGETVAVQLPGGRVLATAVGPEVPREGESPVPPTSPCTFVVTFAAASVAVPLDPGAFTLVDDLGRIRHPQVTAMNGGAPPSEIRPGQTVSLKLHDVLPTGDGGLSWAPDGAARPAVSWDFIVEVD